MFPYGNVDFGHKIHGDNFNTFFSTMMSEYNPPNVFFFLGLPRRYTTGTNVGDASIEFNTKSKSRHK